MKALETFALLLGNLRRRLRLFDTRPAPQRIFVPTNDGAIDASNILRFFVDDNAEESAGT